MAPTHNTALHAWNVKVANAFAKLASVEMYLSSAASRDITACGINAKFTPGDGNAVNVEVTPDETAGLPDGTKRGDFTPGKLAELDAAALAEAKRVTWELIKSRSRRGYLSADASNALLDALGFEARPTERTNVSGYITTEHRDRYGDKVSEYVNFSLPGNVARNEVLARLATVYESSNAKLREAFPEATGIGDVFGDISVQVISAWPDSMESGE